MAAASRFVDALKKSVRARGLTYAALAQRLQLSEASVKRMFSRGTFTLARIEEVLEAVDLDHSTLPDVLFARRDLTLGLAVGHTRAPGAAWGQYVVFFVFPP